MILLADAKERTVVRVAAGPEGRAVGAAKPLPVKLTDAQTPLRAVR